MTRNRPKFTYNAGIYERYVVSAMILKSISYDDELLMLIAEENFGSLNDDSCEKLLCLSKLMYTYIMRVETYMMRVEDES
jgi:hypothetical protein